MTTAQAIRLSDQTIDLIDAAYERAMREGSSMLRDAHREARGLHPFAVVRRRCPGVFVLHEASKPAPLPDAPSDVPVKSWRDVMAVVAKQYMVDASAVLGKNRSKRVVRARAIAVLILNRRGNSMSVIGSWLGKNHSTLIHAVKKVESRMDAIDREFVAGMVPVVEVTDDAA
jgi:hypothetical protein